MARRLKPDDSRHSVWALIDRGRRDVFFQPIVTRGTGRVYGVEALLRSMSPSGRRLSPEFVYAWAQSTGEEHELDRVVLERALLASVILPPGQDLFLNVVPRALPRTIEFWLHQTTRHPKSIVLELVEGPTEGARLGDAVDRLRRLGYRIALDDVGEGYSNLNRIVEAHPDIVEVDIGLIRGVDRSPVQHGLGAAIARFAHRFGVVRVAAERVETASSGARGGARAGLLPWSAGPRTSHYPSGTNPASARESATGRALGDHGMIRILRRAARAVSALDATGAGAFHPRRRSHGSRRYPVGGA